MNSHRSNSMSNLHNKLPSVNGYVPVTSGAADRSGRDSPLRSNRKQAETPKIVTTVAGNEILAGSSLVDENKN